MNSKISAPSVSIKTLGVKDIKIVISSILILFSFFIWYFFSESKKENTIQNSENKKNYVNLEILKTKIKITKDENTIITVNWKKEENSEIFFKK